jgi:endonuclease/exonuclease/phosphatase family metal-dependent hydrolase
LKKFFRNIFLFVNILLAISLVITYLSVYISPDTSWIFAFICMTYPFLLFINILFILFWLIFKKWFFIISLLSILLGWNSVKKSFQIQLKKPVQPLTENSIRLLTYNVRLFNYYQWHKDTATWQKIIDFVLTEEPDVVCFQEFITLPGSKHDLDNLKKKLALLSYSHINYTHRIAGKINFGMATFSKHPIIHKQMIDFENSLNGIIYSDILAGKDTFRIYNCHLQSIKLRNDYNDVLDSLIFNYNEKHLGELMDISIRMRQAFIQRALQVDILTRHVKSSPYPVIVCGDFNDIPVSYTYNKLSSDLEDAFVESGSWTGTTFRGNFPYVRIDYVFYGPHFRAYRYQTAKVNFSDHYPIITDLTLHEKADSTNQHFRLKE